MPKAYLEILQEWVPRSTGHGQKYQVVDHPSGEVVADEFDHWVEAVEFCNEVYEGDFEIRGK